MYNRMALPFQKIYVDSQYKATDSLSTISFKIESTHSVYMPRESIFMIDDVCIPHAWQTIETYFNDKIYFWMKNTSTGATLSRIVRLPNGNYTGNLLGANLQNALDEMVASIAVDSFLKSHTTPWSLL